MANDLLRDNDFMQKKGVCLVAASVKEGLAAGNIDTAATDASNLIVNLPPNAIVTDAYVFVKTVSDAATTAVLTLGTTEGGTQIMSAGNLKLAGQRGVATAPIDTGTGTPVYATFTYTGAATDVGDYVIVIEYVEYMKNTGEYTRV